MQSHSLTKMLLQLRLGLIVLKNSGVMLSAVVMLKHVSPLSAPCTLVHTKLLGNPTAKYSPRTSETICITSVCRNSEKLLTAESNAATFSHRDD